MGRRIVTGRAPDIEELEKMLNDCEDDDTLNDQAIKVFDRLVREVKRVASSHFGGERAKELKQELSDFEQVVRQITKRKHDHVLDRFNQHVENSKI
ncbi:MAG: hypothetical protein A2942_01655 [Candidatus Lloydbacteria bacterium RIFCSPLOWO2_01_FULL_50_20]|uniref:Uncharacterized protein n=1 Tax=Candidatus Lloydbacteria bacterium RIFCSPLOWO2_01_FULL_50_20 TaxID=1798665 RepID=A0A1G2DGT6_9BACT|nr:MAG: hypothetical protein A2942_01655 [Candidatus Lloydbacteria bacterium RIFCSPLOWO2_01_FULL_50_20]